MNKIKLFRPNFHRNEFMKVKKMKEVLYIIGTSSWLRTWCATDFAAPQGYYSVCVCAWHTQDIRARAFKKDI